LLYISSVGIYYFENSVQPEAFKSVFHCLWWSIITLTTVGYGDVYPITVGGKIFTSIILSVIFRLDFSISPYCAVFNAARCYGQDAFFHLLCTD
ncbi:MAG: two pore domain potassium channel family protein, partial [Deltaproteobacteria bacterium]|nr:two pore domain potassium channel family protein [Deltaproteobacteria bacterium]